MNTIDRLVAYFSPGAALRRKAARAALAHYEAGEPSRMRKFHRDRSSPNDQVQRGAAAIRTQARHLAKNHDLARGALRTLVNNVIGPNGIGIDPQPRRRDGTIHAEYAQALTDAYRDWCRYPDVTQRMPWPRLQRAICRAWLRDGEAFGQMITGTRPDLDHGTRVPFSLEIFEAELVPMDLNDESRRIVQGIELNTWGKPIAAHVLKTRPGAMSLPTIADTKRITWERLLHVATLDHVGQVRGVSEFASVITRLEDIKDYEESERVAAKIAAMLTAYVKRGTPDLYSPPEGATRPDPRSITFQPGMIIDDLAVGEEIGLIDSKRPNPNLITFRQGQLRAVAAGVGGSYSSISRDYDGSYSAQRQELVEQWIHYAVLCDEFTGEIIQPVWEAFVIAAHLSGVVPMPADILPGTQTAAQFVAQQMPWIDPLKEANAWTALVAAGFASEVEVIRKRGGKPDDVLRQIAEFRRQADEFGVKIGTPAGEGQDTADLIDDESATDDGRQGEAASRDRIRAAREEAERRIAAAERQTAEMRASAAAAAAHREEAEAQAAAAEAHAADLRTQHLTIQLETAAAAAAEQAAERKRAADARAERHAAEMREIAIREEESRLRLQREALELQAAEEGLQELRQ